LDKISFKNTITALLLGALGSGLWSIAGEPALHWFVSAFIALAQGINKGYYNLLHLDIGKGFHEENGRLFLETLSILAAFFYLFLPLVIYISYKRVNCIEGNDIEEDNLTSTSKITKININIFLILSIILSLLFTPVYISRIIISNYNNKAIVFTERSIEILSPVLTHQEYLKLRADYRLVSGAEGFYIVYDYLQTTAKQHSIRLPEFELAR
jgi:hypothetical protein